MDMKTRLIVALVGTIALFIAYLINKNSKPKHSYRVCPYCRSRVKSKAIICPACRSDIISIIGTYESEPREETKSDKKIGALINIAIIVAWVIFIVDVFR